MNKQTIGRNLLIYNELAVVLNRFNTEKIPVIVLKGAAFADTVYDNIGFRTMDDVDLLVKPKDIVRIKKIMSELGYNQYPDGDWVFAKPDSFFPIEITTEIFYLQNHKTILSLKNRGEGIFSIWQSAQRVKIAGEETLVLSLEDSLIYVAVHGLIHHGLNKNVWIKDIIEILKTHSDRIDWKNFSEIIGEYYLWTPIYFAFFVVAGFVGQDKWRELVPRFVGQTIDKNKPNIFEQKLYQWIIYKKDPYPYNHLLRFFVVHGFINKLKFVWQFLFPSREFIVRRYGIDRDISFLKLIWLRQRQLISQIISRPN